MIKLGRSISSFTLLCISQFVFFFSITIFKTIENLRLHNNICFNEYRHLI